MPDPNVPEFVPDDVIPHQTLPPLRYRDLPEAPRWTALVGPSVILAGLSLGSGEFVFWPYITYKSGFVFFWACMLGVLTQFFMNMEIERWTLATGESAITGFCRLSRWWAPVMLLANFLPWIWPGWATGASLLLSWTLLGPVEEPVVTAVPLGGSVAVQIPGELAEKGQIVATERGQELRWTGAPDERAQELLVELSDAPAWHEGVAALVAKTGNSRGIRYGARYVPWLAIASLLIVGVVLTSSPVVYNTVERLQFWLVMLIFVIAVVLGFLFIEPYAIGAMFRGILSVGQMPSESSGLSLMALLGALAFAGAGGTMNLGQSNFIKDKGYAMGQYIGRITSPITGNEEAVADVGFHFPHTPDNMRRWRQWWQAANIEHFVSFYLTCVACLVLLALLSYSLFYTAAGELKPGMERFGEGMDFVYGEAELIRESFSSPVTGRLFKIGFFVMGMALLLTTELGVLDATVRIATDIIKVNFLRDNPRWSQSRLYFCILWGEILIGTAILLIGHFNPNFKEPLFLLKTSAAMNGGVMFIYSVILLYLNNKILSRSLSMSPIRFVAMVWACGFFGYFTILALKHDVLPYFTSWIMRS
ncbi:MAG: Nramp family divalent metal transporter [Planctomycetales bacterium]